MDHQAGQTAPGCLTEALDSSVQDVAEGRVFDAQTVDREARQIMADYHETQSIALLSRRLGATRRTP